MSDPVRWTGQMPPASGNQAASNGDGTNLADILERVLDKGIVIAGDVQVNLLDIELLTIKLRLVVASVDRAKEMGIDWWERDPTLSSGHQQLTDENARLRARVEELESRNGHRSAIADAEEVAEEVDEGVEAEEVRPEEPDDQDPVDDEPLDDELAEDEPADDESAEDEPADDGDPDSREREPARRSNRGSRPARRRRPAT